MIKKKQENLCPIQLNEQFTAGTLPAQDMSFAAVTTLVRHLTGQNIPIDDALNKRLSTLRNCH
jgi:hypothetical protein